jgi:hypothetical protein
MKAKFEKTEEVYCLIRSDKPLVVKDVYKTHGGVYYSLYSSKEKKTHHVPEEFVVSKDDHKDLKKKESSIEMHTWFVIAALSVLGMLKVYFENN